MNKDKIILSIAFLSILFLAVSCFEEKDPIYEGQAVIEFSNVTYPNLAKLMSQTANNDNIVVQLVSPQQGTDLALTYEIDPASTAIEGVHYNLPEKGSFTIPAQNSFGNIAINLLPGIAAGNTTERRTVIFILTGSSTVKASENYKKLTYTIRN
jgi:hypothetical protein